MSSSANVVSDIEKDFSDLSTELRYPCAKSWGTDTMLLSLLLIAQQNTVSTVLADYRTRTQAEVPCRAPSDEGEIIVCSRREADRYRVPFVTPTLGRDSDAARLNRLIGDPLQQGITPCGKGPFLVRCGMVGVTATVGFDGTVRTERRELAP
jgi:hypothetical protein